MMEYSIIKEGFKLLHAQKRYDQLTIVNKLKYLGYSVSPATFGKILKGGKIGEKSLDTVGKGIQALISEELGYKWENNGYVKLNAPDWKPIEVRKATPKELSIALAPGLVFHPEGRLAIQQKVDFIAKAEKEVIELGVTLNTFTSYFNSRKDSEFKSHVLRLLERGVDFKCYLIDPECNEANAYFEDRRRVQDNEISNIEPIRATIRNLLTIKKEIEDKRFVGKFEVYTYKHIPYNYFMLVDEATPNGSMMVSHYLYGIQRAKCPVIEFTKHSNHDLFKLYLDSFKQLARDAKALVAKGA